MMGGGIYAATSGLAELALQVSVGLALVIGLERLRARTHSVVDNVGAIVIAAFTLAGIVFGLFLIENPLLSGQWMGDAPFFNLILLGYGLPAVLAITLALIA